MWTESDEALLLGLTDELAFEHLAASLGEPRAGASARGAGLMAALRDLPSGESAVRLAAKGELLAVQTLLRTLRLKGQPGPLLHHLAVHFARVAEARGKSAPSAAADAWVLSIAAWLALVEERAYLRSLCEAAAGDALPGHEIARAADEAALSQLENLGAIARDGAREQTSEAQAALFALGRLDEAARLAECPSERGSRAISRAKALRSSAVGEAAAPATEMLAEAEARGDPARAATVALARFAATWHWTGQDEGVEELAVEQATPIAWEVYRAARWVDLRALLAPIEPLVDRLASRIQGDPTRIAYAGPCAQMLVFYAEAQSALDQRIALAERAVRVCPTHRNGRLILANALCDRAHHRLRAATFQPSAHDCDDAAALVARATELYPASKRAPEVQQEIDEARKRGRWIFR